MLFAQFSVMLFAQFPVMLFAQFSVMLFAQFPVMLFHAYEILKRFCLFVCFWRDSPQWVRDYSLTRFLDHTQGRITVGRTPLDECSVRRRDLYLTTHNTHAHDRETSMPLVGFEPTI